GAPGRRHRPGMVRDRAPRGAHLAAVQPGESAHPRGAHPTPGRSPRRGRPGGECSLITPLMVALLRTAVPNPSLGYNVLLRGRSAMRKRRTEDSDLVKCPPCPAPATTEGHMPRGSVRQE